MGIEHLPVDIPMTCHIWLAHAMPSVRKAMEQAWLKHGAPTKDPVRGALNLCEEAGEVAKEALDATRERLAVVGNKLQKSRPTDPVYIERMIEELWQVAGYAILLAVQLEGKQGATDSGNT